MNIELGVDWVPNDRVIAIARATKGTARGEFSVKLLTQHTSRRTIGVPEALEPADRRPLGLSWSDVSTSPGKLAAATAQILHRRGTVIVLVDKPRNSWGVAEAFKVDENRLHILGEDMAHIQQFLVDEMGSDFPMTSLIEYGIGVHHSGLSEDTRTLVEWLTEQSKLRVVVATTTIAQGVIPSLASHQRATSRPSLARSGQAQASCARGQHKGRRSADWRVYNC